jgi:hypothetical protein
VDVPDPIADADSRLAARLPEVQPAVDEAVADAATRSVGMAIAEVGSLYDGGDFQRFLIVISDGERAGLIEARLSGSAVAGLEARGEDVEAHLLERMRSAVGTLPNDGHRYENVILNHPRAYSA